MFAEAFAGVEQELVHRMPARQGRGQGVGEVGADHGQGALDDGQVVLAGLLAPLPAQRQGARVVVGRQLQGALADGLAQPGFELQRCGRLQLPARGRRQCAHRDQAGAVGEVAALRDDAGQVQRRQVAAVAGLDLQLVAPACRAGADFRGRQGFDPAVAGPAAAVVVQQHRAAPVHLLQRRLGALELGAHRRRIVGHQVQPAARGHAVGQSRSGQGAFGHAPQRRGQAREQPERGQCQRQPDRHQPADRAQPLRQRQRADAALQVGQALQRQQSGQHRDQGAGHHQRALVEQEGGERGEQGEADQAACVAQAAQFAGLDRQHRRQQGAAGITAQARAHHREHRRDHRQGQRHAQPGRERMAPGDRRGRRRGQAEPKAECRGQGQQQGQQGQCAGDQRPAAGAGIERQRPGSGGSGGIGGRGDGRVHACGSSASARRQAWRCSGPRPGPKSAWRLRRRR